MGNTNQSSKPPWPDPDRTLPPEEVLLSDLVDRDDMDALSDKLVDNGADAEPRVFKLNLPAHLGGNVTGGDPDDDWYQAEVVGEEAVGGENPTPDQNVTEDLLRSMGIAAEDHESVRTQNKLEWRDHQRWELNPESAEDYRERK